MYFKYSKAYSGSDKVSFLEEDVFVTQVPLDDLIDSNKLELNVNLVDTEQKSVEKGVEKSVEKSVEKIIALLYQNPYITQIEISKMTNLTRRGVEKNIAKLKSSGIIERIGPDKGGYWKVKI